MACRAKYESEEKERIEMMERPSVVKMKGG